MWMISLLDVTEQEVLNLHQECNKIMTQVGMTVSKWSSSHGIIGKEQEGQESLKIFGVQWNPKPDEFHFNGISMPTAVVVTKRRLKLHSTHL